MAGGKGVALISREITKGLGGSSPHTDLGYHWEAGTQDLDKAASVKAMSRAGLHGPAVVLQVCSGAGQQKDTLPLCIPEIMGKLLLKQTNAEAPRQV